MPINEYSGLAPKERWPTQFDIEGVPRDNNVRQRLVEERNMALANKFAGERVVPRDLGAPVHVPYVFRMYPKCLYHPTKKTEASVQARIRAENHNKLHPATPLLVPELLPLTRIVNNKEEERKAFGEGFIDKAPNPEGWTAPDPPVVQFDVEIDAPADPVTEIEAQVVDAYVKPAPKRRKK